MNLQCKDTVLSTLAIIITRISSFELNSCWLQTKTLQCFCLVNAFTLANYCKTAKSFLLFTSVKPEDKVNWGISEYISAYLGNELIKFY